MDKSKFHNGRAHFRNSGIEGLIQYFSGQWGKKNSILANKDLKNLLFISFSFQTEEDDEETESDSSQTNTEQFQAPSDTSWTHPLNMQAPAQSSPYTIGSSANSTSQMNPGFTASSNLANLMPPSIPQHNPTSPRLPMLQSPPDFSNISMMPRPQLQNMSSQLPPPQQQFSGLTNQIPPPPLLTNFSNQLPGQPNFYQAHQLQMQQYPKINSQETFQSDQKSFMPSREAPSFSQTPSCPQFKQEEVNPDRSLGNIVTNNEPLDMSRSSLSQRYSISQM